MLRVLATRNIGKGYVAKRISEGSLKEIEEAVSRNPGAATAQQIAHALKLAIPQRTLQYRLKHLVDNGRLVRDGDGRWAKYRLPTIIARGNLKAGDARLEGQVEVLSKAGAEIQAYVRQPVEARKPTGYKREFLDSYRPNVSSYLTEAERTHLHLSLIHI